MQKNNDELNNEKIEIRSFYNPKNTHNYNRMQTIINLYITAAV